MNAYKRDFLDTRLGLVVMVLALVLMIALIPFGIWLRFAAPCKYVDWMPVNEVPTRCLEVRVR